MLIRITPRVFGSEWQDRFLSEHIHQLRAKTRQRSNISMITANKEWGKFPNQDAAGLWCRVVLVGNKVTATLA